MAIPCAVDVGFGGNPPKATGAQLLCSYNIVVALSRSLDFLVSRDRMKDCRRMYHVLDGKKHHRETNGTLDTPPSIDITARNGALFSLHTGRTARFALFVVIDLRLQVILATLDGCPPKRYCLLVPKSGRVRALRQALSKACGLGEDRLILTDIWQHNVQTVLKVRVCFRDE